MEQVRRASGVSHITGGGFYENIPRSLTDGLLRVLIKKSAVRTAAHLRRCCQKTGNIPERDMFNTFNMGVGMAVTVAARDTADKALAHPEGQHGAGCVQPGRDRRRERVMARLCMNVSLVLVSGGGTNLQAILESEAPRGEPQR